MSKALPSHTKTTEVVVITGPTCSGKSKLALCLVEQYRKSVVINADSMQIYSDLSILTARPHPQSLSQIEHRLYGTIAAPRICSAGGWQTWCYDEIMRCRSRGYLPVIVGGSGLYLRTLIDSLTELPQIPASIRHQARTYLQTLQSHEFHKLLTQQDPHAAASVRPSDGYRIARAWEVLQATGQSLTQWHAKAIRRLRPNLHFHWIILLPPRERLYHACDTRFDKMMTNHVLEEVEAFDTKQIDADHPLTKAIGLSELRRFLRGDITRETAIHLTKQATRRYAKRQMTWLRHQMIERLHAVSSDRVSIFVYQSRHEIISEVLRYLD